MQTKYTCRPTEKQKTKFELSTTKHQNFECCIANYLATN